MRVFYILHIMIICIMQYGLIRSHIPWAFALSILLSPERTRSRGCAPASPGTSE